MYIAPGTLRFCKTTLFSGSDPTLSRIAFSRHIPKVTTVHGEVRMLMMTLDERAVSPDGRELHCTYTYWRRMLAEQSIDDPDLHDPNDLLMFEGARVVVINPPFSKTPTLISPAESPAGPASAHPTEGTASPSASGSP